MLDVRFRPSTAAWPQRARYERANRTCTETTLYDALEREMKHLRAHSLVIEGGFTEHQIRNDGYPMRGAMPTHPGVRLFFQAPKLGALCYTMNRYDDWRQNLRAIGLVLERQRLISLEGVGTGAEVYQGFKALPSAQAPATPSWSTRAEAAEWLYRVVWPTNMGGLVGGSKCLLSSPECLQDVYRLAAQKAHPDLGGTNERMAKVNAAKAFIENGGRA